MPPEITIRPALPEEADDLSALCRRSKASHGYDDELMQLFFADGDLVIAAEAIVRDTFMVAEIEGRMAGFAHLMPIDRPDTVYLEDLFIEPAFQGQGVGRALFEWALTEAGVRGYGWLEWDSDPNAAAFYEKMGGEKIGENPSTLRDDRLIPKFRRATGAPTGSDQWLTFRRAIPNEAEALRALKVRAKASHGYDAGYLSLLTDTLDRALTAEVVARDTFMVAEFEGRTVGFARLMPVDRPEIAYLEDLFVEPDKQGLGVGRALFAWALGEADRRGCAWLEWQSDPNASAFYEKLGGMLVSETESKTFPGRMVPTFRKATGPSG